MSQLLDLSREDILLREIDLQNTNRLIMDLSVNKQDILKQSFAMCHIVVHPPIFCSYSSDEERGVSFTSLGMF